MFPSELLECLGVECPSAERIVGAGNGKLNAVDQRADVLDGPGAGKRRDEWRWRRGPRDDAGDADLVEVAVVLAGAVAQERTCDDDGLPEALRPCGRLWVIETQPGDLGSFPSRPERGF